MRIDIQTTVNLLKEKDNILIICHESPDGDTTGSGFGLAHALRFLGKTVGVICSDEFPKNCKQISESMVFKPFKEEFVVAVDIADASLIGTTLADYRDKVDLCIDHHVSNKNFAKALLLDAKAAATAELMADVITGLGVPLSKNIANCLYTGISTDTGCFRYTNTTAHTHLTAAKLIEAGADHAEINRTMFETKSRSRVEIEKQVYNKLEYFFDQRCAMVCITNEMLEAVGITNEELEGITSLPRQIEGVEVGITIRERNDNSEYKISVRTNSYMNASTLCSKLGGGGHAKAAGCTVLGTLEEAKNQILAAVAEQI
ncbi:MAG: DHH family phosphoesterase [Oscillospiraceae bacterium]